MKDSESTAEIHFILDYLPLQTNLRVLKMNKRRKNTRGRGAGGKKSRCRDSKRQMDRARETDYTRNLAVGESPTED